MIKRILRCFELTSGLKINLARSMLVVVDCRMEMVQVLARNLSCKVGKLPIIYFGLPNGVNPKLKAFWNPMVEKFERKLSWWKRNYLSLGGKIALIKATLSKLPIYYMSLFKMPATVRERLDHL